MTTNDDELIQIENNDVSVVNKCSEHQKVFDSYCKTHDSALCELCVLSQHESCDDIISIIEASKNAKTSAALVDLEEAISVGLIHVQKIIEKTSLVCLEKQEKIIKDEIRGFRIELNNRLDEMEQNLISELELKFSIYRSKYSTVLKHIEELGKAMNILYERTNSIKNIASDMHVFLGTHQLNREVQECLKSTLQYDVTDRYNVNVEIEPVLKTILTDIETFGSINTEVIKINIPLSQPDIFNGNTNIHEQPLIRSVLEIGVKLKQHITITKEIRPMCVTGCSIIPNGLLLIADCWGEEQLMLYNEDGTHARDISISSKPYDVTVVDSDRVAVSYGESEYIEIVNIQNDTVERVVNLYNATRGLSYQGGKFYVVVDNRGIVVIDLTGKIVNTIYIDVSTVGYVTTSTDRIYYSDYYTDIVTSCDMTGKQIWQFQDASIQYLYGISVDNNQNVFVVGQNTNNVIIISRDGKTSKVLLTESDGLDWPRSICCDKDNGDLLVCNEDTKAALYSIIQ